MASHLAPPPSALPSINVLLIKSDSDVGRTGAYRPVLDNQRAARQDRPRPLLQRGRPTTATTTTAPTGQPTTTLKGILVKRKLVSPRAGTKIEKPKKRVQFGDTTVREIDD